MGNGRGRVGTDECRRRCTLVWKNGEWQLCLPRIMGTHTRALLWIFKAANILHKGRHQLQYARDNPEPGVPRIRGNRPVDGVALEEVSAHQVVLLEVGYARLDGGRSAEALLLRLRATREWPLNQSH